MANRKQDHDDTGPNGEPSGAAPRPAGEGAERSPTPEGFLPDDSFLLDVDDEAARTPAPMADPAQAAAGVTTGEEWIVVDDDLSTGEPAAAAETRPLEPAAAAAEPPPAAQTAIPKWFSGEESDLPAFAAQDSEVASANAPVADAAPADAAGEPDEAPVEPTASAPVIPIERARRRRMLVAAAGLIVAIGLGATFYFTRGDETGTEPVVAVRPKPTREPAPVTPPVEVPDEAPVIEPPVVAVDPVEPAPVEPIAPAPVAVAPAPERARVPDPTPAAIDPRPKRPLPSSSPRGTVTPPRKDDTIVELKNGHTFRGQITRVKGTRVSLRVGNGECTFDLSEVTLLDSSAPEYRRIDQMPEASVLLATGQHLRGRLMKQTEQHVVLVVNNGQVIFPRADIKDVSFTGRIHF